MLQNTSPVADQVSRRAGVKSGPRPTSALSGISSSGFQAMKTNQVMNNEYLGFLRLGESENDLKHRNAFCVHALTRLTRLLQLRTHSESFRVSRGDCYLFVPATLTRHHGNIWKYIIYHYI